MGAPLRDAPTCAELCVLCAMCVMFACARAGACVCVCVSVCVRMLLCVHACLCACYVTRGAQGRRSQGRGKGWGVEGGGREKNRKMEGSIVSGILEGECWRDIPQTHCLPLHTTCTCTPQMPHSSCTNHCFHWCGQTAHHPPTAARLKG